MSENPAPLQSEPRASVDYLRKLHQQLVQKDNIIKLLQLQVKELDGEGGRGEDAEALDRLTSALAEAEDRIAELEEGGGLAEAAAVPALRARLQELEKSAGDSRRLEAALTLRQEEIERLKETLRGAEQEARGRERLREERDQLQTKLARAEAELGSARERASRLGKGAEPGAVAALRDQVADLEAALELARQHIDRLEAAPAEAGEGAAATDEFALVVAVIEALQVLEDHRLELFDAGEALGRVEGFLVDMRDALGLERIPTTGEQFDPRLHAAGRILYTEDGTHQGVVAEEVAGYRLGERVVKQAQVTLVRNPYECQSCGELGVKGATFCHVCGVRIAARYETRDEGAARARPRDEARKLLDIARSERRRGGEEAARERIQKALELAPEDPQVAFEVALLEEEAGHFARAAERLAALPERVPGLKGLEALRARLEDKQQIVERLKRMR